MARFCRLWSTVNLKNTDIERVLGPSNHRLCPGHNLKEVSSQIKMWREEGGVCSISN